MDLDAESDGQTEKEHELSPNGADEDPIWTRIKAQSEPLRKKTPKQKNQKKPEAKPKSLPSRPIRDGNLGGASQAGVERKIAPKPPVREDGHRRIRRGRVEISAQIDLHGMFEPEARARLLGFLQSQPKHRALSVLVITGKGERGDGVLRRSLANWLQSPEFSSMVSGFAQAHLRHGGSGAWYVFLRAAK